MKIRQETTVWDDVNIPNHTYITSGSYLEGYIPAGTTKAIYFKSPKKEWSTTRRKFRTLGKREISQLEI